MKHQFSFGHKCNPCRVKVQKDIKLTGSPWCLQEFLYSWKFQTQNFYIYFSNKALEMPQVSNHTVYKFLQHLPMCSQLWNHWSTRRKWILSTKPKLTRNISATHSTFPEDQSKRRTKRKQQTKIKYPNLTFLIFEIQSLSSNLSFSNSWDGFTPMKPPFSKDFFLSSSCIKHWTWPNLHFYNIQK